MLDAIKLLSAIDRWSLEIVKNYDYENKVFSLPYSEQTEAFSKILVEALEKFVPAKSVTIRDNDVDLG